VLRYAVGNWLLFGSTAKANAGLHDYPAQPHTGFLLAHAATATQLWQQEVAQAAAPSLQPIANPAPATVEALAPAKPAAAVPKVKPTAVEQQAMYKFFYPKGKDAHS